VKASEIRKKSLPALIARVDNLRLELTQVRKSLVLGESQDTAKISKLRRELSQTLTLISEKSSKEEQS